jgi:hypothetical protein
MKKIIILSLISFFTLQPQLMAITDIWKMGDHFFEFTKDDAKDLLISKFCDKKNCDALKALAKISFKNIGSDKLSGGKNPGAVLCQEIPNAHIVYLKDLHGNDNSFCQFKDLSMVSSSTLSSYASKNDKN